MRYQGKITRWNDEKGFGFITPKGGSQQVFVHIRGFDNRNRRPLESEPISYELGSDAKGRCCAVNVRYADVTQAAIELRISMAPMLWVMFFAVLLVGAAWGGRIPVIVPIIYFILSLITFLIYAFDKAAAEAGRWRTKEKTLHLFSLACGWPGAIFAQQFLRHKSSKREFQSDFWMMVILNCGALAWLSSEHGETLRMLLSNI